MEDEDGGGSQRDEEEEEDIKLSGEYEYLLGMKLWMLTKERKDELLNMRDDKLAELKTLQAKTPSSLWKEDLEVFIEEVSSEKIMHFLKKPAFLIAAFGNLSCYYYLIIYIHKHF
jgi:hypothetical protein